MRTASRSLRRLLSLGRRLGPAALLLLSLGLGSARATTIPIADYGDAPDGLAAGYGAPYQGVVGRFPTDYGTANGRYGLPGGHTLNADGWLGAAVSFEQGARDCQDPDGIPNLIDGDLDDGLSGSFCPASPNGPFDPAGVDVTLALKVTLSPGASTGRRYVNVLVDLNHDGTWSGSAGNTEWVVQDFPVDNLVAGQTQTIHVGPFKLPSTISPTWMRVALTTEPVANVVPVDATGWDGSGEFASGEIEDYYINQSVSHAVAASYSAASAKAWADAVAAAWAQAQAWATASATSCSGASASASAAATASGETAPPP